MKANSLTYTVILIVVSLLLGTSSFSQSTGFINRQATTSAGRTILDPNSDGYASKTLSGFNGDDVTNSEVAFKPVPSFSKEPFGDLRRGPNHLFSDFVPDVNNVGYYTHYDGSNLLFRFRMGSVMPGSKGYTVLIDTDGKFGATGSEADPNYLPSTTGTNGNPGFEIEVILETNFRIAIYNVDGTSSPVLVKAYNNWQDMSQVSIAGTFDNGDPDFFIDFYIPFSDLQVSPFNLTTSTPLRMIATTVMSPQAAIGGPKSDIYGLADNDYKSSNDQYEAFIKAQPKISVTSISTTGFGKICTAPPSVNNPVSTGVVTISGTWTKSNLSGAANSATINVLKNGVSIGTISNVASGSSWSLSGISTINGDVITAQAQGLNESMCLMSNSVIATNCNNTNRPAQPAGFCGDRKGFSATNYPAGATINLYRVTSTGNTLVAAGVLGTNGFTSDGAGGWTLNGGCSAGGGTYTGGTYMVYYTSGGCDSKVSFTCANNTQGGWSSIATTSPVLNQSALYTSSTSISGTALAGSTIKVYVDDILIGSPVLSGTNWSYDFTSPLSLGQVVKVTAQIADNATTKTYYCIGEASLTVTCFTAPPLISVDNNNQIAAGSNIIGVSGEPIGTTIRVYSSPSNTLVATTTVQNGGTWNSGFAAVNGTSYYATAQNGSCSVSAASGTTAALSATVSRCGTINSPISAGDATITGTLNSAVASTTVNLYLDGTNIGSVITGTNTWSINTSSLSVPLYANGVLTIGVQESGRGEQYCSGSAVAITCNTGPATPVISPTSSVLSPGQTQSYTISNAVVGAFYGLADATTGQSLGNGVWATSNTLILTTATFTTGNYNVVVKGTSLSGVSVCSSAPAAANVVVSGVLPLMLVNFNAAWEGEDIEVKWITEGEKNIEGYEVQKSSDGTNFKTIGYHGARNNESRNTYAFTDKETGEKNYYKLKFIEKDGKTNYSKVIGLHKTNQYAVSIKPNPFSSSITVSLSLERIQQVSVSIYDANGRQVYIKNVIGENGLNIITLNDVHTLKQGFYFVYVKDENNNSSLHKLIKSN